MLWHEESGATHIVTIQLGGKRSLKSKSFTTNAALLSDRKLTGRDLVKA
jgi:hypothetical protein